MQCKWNLRYDAPQCLQYISLNDEVLNESNNLPDDVTNIIPTNSSGSDTLVNIVDTANHKTSSQCSRKWQLTTFNHILENKKFIQV